MIALAYVHSVRCPRKVLDNGIERYCAGEVKHTEGIHWHCHDCGHRYHDSDIEAVLRRVVMKNRKIILSSGRSTDIHKHKCSKCGHSWIHDALVIKDAHELNDTHICPAGCGNYELDKHYDKDTDPRPSGQEETEVLRFYASLYVLKKKPETFGFFKMAVGSALRQLLNRRKDAQ